MTVQVTVRGFPTARTVAAEIRSRVRGVLASVPALRVSVRARKLGESTACSVFAWGPHGVWLVRAEHADPVEATRAALQKLHCAAPSAPLACAAPSAPLASAAPFAPLTSAAPSAPLAQVVGVL